MPEVGPLADYPSHCFAANAEVRSHQEFGGAITLVTELVTDVRTPRFLRSLEVFIGLIATVERARGMEELRELPLLATTYQEAIRNAFDPSPAPSTEEVETVLQFISSPLFGLLRRDPDGDGYLVGDSLETVRQRLKDLSLMCAAESQEPAAAGCISVAEPE